MVRSSQTLVLACTLAFSACCDESWGVWEPGNEVNISACSLGAHKGTLGAHISLIPRPFPPPVFNRLQYKNGGEGLGERVTCVTSGRREGRCEGGGARQRISRSFL